MMQRFWGWVIGFFLVVPMAWGELINPDIVIKTDTQTTAQTSKTLWTPKTGARIVLTGCSISSENAALIALQSSSVDVVPNTFVQTGTPFVIGTGYSPIWVGAANGTLTYTSTPLFPGAFRHSVMCYGYELFP